MNATADALLACEIRDGGKVSELAEGDFAQIRATAEYFCDVAQNGSRLGDGSKMQVADNIEGYTYREPWGVVAGNHSLELSDRVNVLVHLSQPYCPATAC